MHARMARARRGLAMLAVAYAALAQPGHASAGPAISVISAQSHDGGRGTQHLSGDALQFGSRYRIVIVPDSDRPLSVSVTGNKNLYYASQVAAGRPLQLPSGNGWYTVPAASSDIQLLVSQNGANSEHIISPIDPSTPRSVVFDGAASGSDRIKASPLSSSLPAQDFRAIFARYRAVALGLANIKEPLTAQGSAAAIYRQASPSVVVVLADQALGAGIVVAPGEVVTNWHVVENAKVINVAQKPPAGVTNPPRVLHEAKLVRYDQVADLALIRYGSPSAPPLKLGDEKNMEVGNTVHAIGHPEREYWSYTQGVISQIRPNYKWEYDDGTQHSATVIQTQTPINPGSSGGPLLDDQAAVVGITSYSTVGTQGLNFAIAATEIKRFLASNEDRIAARKPPKTAAAPKMKAAAAQVCEPKALSAYVDRPSGKSITLVDTDCGGRANVASVADRTGSRLEYALVDAFGERKTAIKIIFNFRENTNLWIFYGQRDGVPTAYGYEHNGSGRPGRFVAIDGAR